MSRTKVPIPKESQKQKSEKRERKERKKNKKKEKKNKKEQPPKSNKFAYEIHKFLYKVQTVFPPRDVQEASSMKHFTLPAGDYSFPFKITIPENMVCDTLHQPSSLSISRFELGSKGITYIKDASAHTVSQLPPPLSDMGKKAYVRYYVKATVNRASILKKNIRIFQPLKFLPKDLEIPRGLPQFLFIRRSISFRLDEPSLLSNRQEKEG